MNKGVVLERKFLSDLLPGNYSETVVEYPKYYAIRCIKQTSGHLPDKEWDALVEKIINEFGDENIMEIDSNTCYGIDFVVYLKKSI